MTRRLPRLQGSWADILVGGNLGHKIGSIVGFYPHISLIVSNPEDSRIADCYPEIDRIVSKPEDTHIADCYPEIARIVSKPKEGRITDWSPEIGRIADSSPEIGRIVSMPEEGHIADCYHIIGRIDFSHEINHRPIEMEDLATDRRNTAHYPADRMVSGRQIKAVDFVRITEGIVKSGFQ